MNKNNIKQIYQLSPMQEGMLFSKLLNDDNKAYFEQLSFKIIGDFKIDIFEQTMNKLIGKYDVFRSLFIHENQKRPFQIVFKKARIRLVYEDFSSLEDEKIELAIKDFKEKDIEKGFDLSKEIAIRASIIKVNSSKYTCILSFHHIILDGWSLPIVLNDILEIYTSLKNSSEISIIEVAEYSNYIKWVESQSKESALNYWKDYLEDYNSEIVIPKFDRHIDIKEYKNKFYDFAVSKELTDKLKEMAKEYRITVNSIFQSIWGILLQRYSNTNDVVFGAVVSGRPAEIKGIENMVGLFINTVPVRVKSEENESFIDLAKTIHKKSIESKKYEYISLAQIQSNSTLKRQLVENIVAFENYPIEKYSCDSNEGNGPGFEIVMDKYTDQTSYDFNILVDIEELLMIKVNYNSCIYSYENIDMIVKHINNIISQVAGNPQVILSNIDIITECEKEKIFNDFNNTKRDYPSEKTIVELFEEQVEKQKKKIAVVYGDKSISYGELNEKANSLAAILREEGVKSDSIVALMSNKSVEMVIGLIAILKAGGAYLPIDSNSPSERIEYMLRECKPNIILTQGEIAKDLYFEGKIIDLDFNNLYEKKVNNLENINSEKNLAYVIYTSGSTGKPKGVMIEQKSVVRLVKNTNYIEFKNDDKILQTGNIAFDASTFEIWGSLLNGLELHLIDKEIMLDVENLEKYIITNKITILFVTTALYNSITESKPTVFKYLRVLLTGGEAAQVSSINKIRNLYSDLQLINIYGPTENTTYSTFFLVDNIYNRIPIGRSISNSTAFIVDKYNRLQPVGVCGELCVGGDGLARGYLNDTILTKEKFINLQFDSKQVIYKTGDLARWLPNGNIEFLGRIDHQVKIRGFRIEIGEIENTIINNFDIKSVIVIDKVDERGSKYLCAYFIADEEIKPTRIKCGLESILPGYMIPTFFIQLEEMPLNQNGKIDRKLLPEPKYEDIIEEQFIEARNEEEEKIIEVLKEVLHINKISINDNFLEIGGHSLNAISVIVKFNKELGIDIPIGTFLDFEKISDIYNYVTRANSSEIISIEKAKEKEYYEASSAQKRIYMAQQLQPDSNCYNITEAIEVSGEIDIKRLQDGILELIDKHEVLRTTFHIVNGEIVQKIHPITNIDFKIEQIFLECEEDIDKKIIECVQSYNLQEDLLLTVKVITLTENRHILFLDIHHIIADGTSIGILLKQLTEYDKNNKVEKQNIQYKDYSEWQKRLINSDVIKQQEEYWLDVFKDELPILNMDTDYKRAVNRNFDGDSISFILDEDIVGSLKKLAKESNLTMYMLFLSIYTVLLSKYSSQEDIIVGTPTTGRNNYDLQNLIGMFVNTLTIRNYPKANKTFNEYLKDVKENVLRAFENQDYQFEQLIEKFDLDKNPARNPLFDTMLVLQNIEESNFKFGDLKILGDRYKNNISKFDFTLTLSEANNEIKCDLEYATQLFKKSTMERFSVHFIKLIKQVISNKNLMIKDINILDKNEIELILKKFNDSSVDYCKDKTIHELFEEQAKLYPNNIAVVYENIKLTYEEVNKRANRLARVLRDNGVKSNTIVSIIGNRSVDLIVAMLGVLKAGGAYLPIDPEYPESRIKYIIEDSKTEILLTIDEFNISLDKEINIINVLDEKMLLEESINLKNNNTISDLAYVIYTSGSTGNPKGVMVEHKGIPNLKKYFENELGITRDDNILQFASCSFDAAVWEISQALIIGGSLFIVSKDRINDINEFQDYLNKNNITVATLPPAYASNLIPEKIPSLRVLITAGSESNYKLVEMWSDKVKYVNAYGPTETTVCASAWSKENDKYIGDSIPIGKPICNTQIYILNKYGDIQPIGVSGELCIGGAGIARGYINNKQLTNEKFIPTMFANGELIYRTGDMARWLEDGNVEFRGRIDYQIKVRGYRLEIEEIERQILCHENIKDVAVIAKKDNSGENYLVCYYVSDVPLSASDIRLFLLKYLPEYMLPLKYMQLEDIPKNQSGKPDRKILNQLSNDIVVDKRYKIASNKYERILLEIWQKVLNSIDISVDDDFFILGGDSIKAIKVIYLLNEENITLKIKDIYKYRTIEKLATVVKMIENKVQDDVIGNFELLPIQKWFFDLNKIDSQHFHQSIMLQSSVKLDVNVLRDIFIKIQNYHDALRTSYYMKDGEFVGEIMDENYPLNYRIIDIDNNELDEILINDIIEGMQKNVNLKAGSMMNSIVFKTNEIDYLYICIHHLAVDTVSWGIILNDIETLYNQYLNNESYKLANKTSSIKEWSEEIYEYSNSREFLEEKKYWSKIQNKKLEDLPYDFKINSNLVKDGKVIELLLTEEETAMLIKQTNRVLKCDIVDVLLSTLATSLYRISGNKENSIMFEGHGREELFENINLQRTVGWFTSTFPMILETDESDDIITTLDRTILIRNSIPNSGIGYNILKYITDESNKKYIDWSNIPKISFNYHGDTDSNNISSLFNVVQNNYGSNVSEKSERQFELEFNGEISNKKLRVMLTYNENAFNNEFIRNLVHSYKERLIEVINLNLDSIRKDDFTESIKYLANKYNIPGLIVGVNYNNNIVIGSEGKANIDENIVLNGDYKIKIGSITKTFVATIILQLVEENLLYLDRSINYYLPSVVKSYEKLDFSKTTIRSLLNHSSGIRDYTKNQRILIELQDGYCREWNKEELLELGLEISNNEEMKSNSWMYSSTGYILLGMIIEKITNLSLEQNIENRICKKLNLINTKMIELNDINKEFVHCYSNLEKIDVTNSDLTLGWAAGGMISTAEDLLIWIEALNNGTLFKNKDIMKEFIDVSVSYPGNNDVKAGLGIFSINNFVGHEGNGIGYQNVLFKHDKYSYLIHLNQNISDENTTISQSHKILNDIVKLRESKSKKY